MYSSLLMIPVIGSILSVLMCRVLGREGVLVVVSLSILESLLVALYGVYEIGIRGNCVSVYYKSWLNLELLDGSLSLGIDSLSITMSVLVLLITLLVLIYSSEYLEGDDSLVRYLLYIGGFSSSMLLLVLSDNLLGMFIGFEGVGIVSYLLISYWSKSIDGSKSSLQAVLVNRVGDVSILIGVSLLYKIGGSLNYELIFSSGILYESEWMLGVGLILLVVGCVSKSGQLGLHIWLPNAMAAPTPISALLHAATMVTAGIYVIVRLSPLISGVPYIGDLLVVIGGMTIVVAGGCGLVSKDMKRVVAYSTGSQLGYMLLSCGLGGYKLAMFHLLNHGFFKSLLFLSAGLVIHGVRDEQDIRRMGGLRKLMPLAYMGFIVGSLALVGFPYLSGYYSKDLILEASSVSIVYRSNGLLMGYILAIVGSLLTSIYSVRLLYLVYIGNPSSRRDLYESVSEGSYRMKLPVVFLSVSSVVVGYLLRDGLGGIGSDYWSTSIGSSIEERLFIEAEFISSLSKILPLLMVMVGIGSYVFFCVIGSSYRLKVGGMSVYRLLSRRYLFDKIYNEVVVQGLLSVSKDMTYKGVDKGLLESLGSQGISSEVLGPIVGLERWLIRSSVYSSILIVVCLTVVVLLAN